MDSPKSDGNAADTEPSFPASSLPAQKSPFSKFLSNLSPIESSARTSRYTQRLSQSTFPSNQSVFGSPHFASQRESSRREEIVDSSSNDHRQCYSPSSSAKKHLALGSLSLDENKILGFSENIWNHDHLESDEVLEDHVGQEASHHQQGIRRHLQFETTINGKAIAGFNYHDSSDSVGFTENSGNQAMSSHTKLQLTDVAKSVPLGSDVISIENLAGCQSSQEKHMPGRSNYLLKDISDSLISSGRVVFDNVDSDHLLLDNIKPPWDSQQAMCFDEQTLPLAEKAEELPQCQDNSKAKRKRETSIDESEGCKRCNCKRSKCLKLYCECFAAGIYCVDSCACENCYNKPEYEDTVSDVREQIELRNPLAFAPTVVKQANSSPNVVDDPNWTTPSSARHKRGCKCKRSKCLKKYCECYRAKVGCSDGCRCEGCDNYFGKKSESIFGPGKRKNPSHEKLNTAEVVSDGRTANKFSPTWEELVNLSRLTPPFSHTNSRAVPSSTSSDMSDFANVSQAQSQEGNGLQSFPSQFHWCSSVLNPTPLAYVSKSPHEFGSTNAASDMKLKDNCNSTNTLKAHSPKQKRVSPPQLQSDRSDSSSKLQSSRKLILQAVDSSPPLTSYCNSEDQRNQMANDHKASGHDFE